MLRTWPVALVSLLTLTLSGCSDDNGSPVADGPRPDLGSAVDQAGPDGPAADQASPDGPAPDTLTTTAEQEPNNGSTDTEYNTIQVPAQVTGAIGQPDDIDLFGITVQAGQRFTVSLTSDGTLEPHLVIFDPAGDLPTAANPGPGTSVLAEYYALKSATLLIGVRDRRNVGSTSQQVGGPAFTYTLTVAPLNRSPINATVGSQQTASLSPPGTVRVFAFTTNQNDDLDVAVQVTGNVDARLSLFHPGQKKWLGTNENPTSQSALLQGPMPFSGTVHAIVENVAETFSGSLDFTLAITKN